MMFDYVCLIKNHTQQSFYCFILKFLVCFRRGVIAMKRKISIIGDGLETDIAGGNTIGINTVLITSGILSQDLNTKYKEMPDKNLLYKIIKRSKFIPNAAAVTFSINS